MIEFAIGIVAGIVASIVLVRLAVWYLLKKAEQRLQELIQTVEQAQANSVQARVEEHDGVFYVYNAEDNTFMVQGTNIAELKKRINERWKDVRVYVTEGDESVLERLKATAE